MLKFICCSVIPLLLASCLKEHQGLDLVNRSEETIFYVWDSEDSLFANTPYPLTPIYQKIENYMGTGKNVVLKGIEGHKLLPDSSARIIGGGRIEYGFRGSSAKIELERHGGYITIFIFNKEFLRKYKWSDVIEKQLYTKKYRYSVAELEKLNWKIIYK